MNITRSLCCRRLSFTNAVSCPHCSKAFPQGELDAKSATEERVFNRKAYGLFVATLVVIVVTLFVFRAV